MQLHLNQKKDRREVKFFQDASTIFRLQIMPLLLLKSCTTHQ